MYNKLENFDNMSLNEKIIYSHEVREQLALAIKNANVEEGEKLFKISASIVENSELGILKRTEGLRALKNIFLSFNTLFSYNAELGGLSPILAHY